MTVMASYAIPAACRTPVRAALPAPEPAELAEPVTGTARPRARRAKAAGAATTEEANMTALYFHQSGTRRRRVS